MKIPSINLSFINNLSVANLLNLSHPSWDLFIGALFIIVALIYAITFGRNRAIIALVSIYMGLGAVIMFPLAKFKLADIFLEGFYLNLLVFSFFTIMAFLLLSNSFLSRIFGYARVKEGKWWQIFLYSFLHIGLLVMIILSFLSEKAVVQLAPITTFLFTTSWSKFIWIVLPIAALFFIRKESY